MRQKITKGQKWTYVTREGETDSILTILELDKEKEIAHISLDHLKIKNTKSGEIILTSIEHLPVTINKLKENIKTMVDVVNVNKNEGYLYWEEMYNKNEAGIWSIDIASIVEIIEGTYNNS